MQFIVLYTLKREQCENLTLGGSSLVECNWDRLQVRWLHRCKSNPLDVCKTLFTRFCWCRTDSSQHFPFLFIVHATEQLAFFQHELIPSLQPSFALAAAEAAQVVHLSQHAHYQLWTSNHLHAGTALPYKQPGGAEWDTHGFIREHKPQYKNCKTWHDGSQ